MFTFLFDLRTPSLTLPSFYRSIHHQLGPLQRPLLSSTSPQNISRRIFIADCDAGSQKRASSAAHNPIYDLVYDPSNLTVRSSIPNIPEPEFTLPPQTSDNRGPWSRMEALNIHNQFLSTYTDTRSRPVEMERTCKTSRGWWLVWVRIPSNNNNNIDNYDTFPNTEPPREAFLIRKADDYSLSHQKHAHAASSGSRFFRDLSGVSGTSSSPGGSLSGGGGGSTTAAGKLGEGLGFDAQRYIESLLSLNR
jgi:hypothetical protein